MIILSQFLHHLYHLFESLRKLLELFFTIARRSLDKFQSSRFRNCHCRSLNKACLKPLKNVICIIIELISLKFGDSQHYYILIWFPEVIFSDSLEVFQKICNFLESFHPSVFQFVYLKELEFILVIVDQRVIFFSLFFKD